MTGFRQVALFGILMFNVGVIGESDTLAACRRKMRADVFFLIDISRTLEKYYDSMKTFVKTSVDVMTSSTQVDAKEGLQFSVIQFSSNAKLEIKLNQAKSVDEFKKAVDDLVKGGSSMTDVYKPLLLASTESVNTENGARPDITKIFILLTDGYVKNADKCIPQAKDMRDAGYFIFSIGIGTDVAIDKLSALAGSPDNVLASTSDISSGATTAILLRACSVVPSPPPPPPPGQMDEMPNFCPPTDVLFLLDFSSSFDNKDYLLSFVARYVTDVVPRMSKYDTQVGVILFYNGADELVKLNEFSEKEAFVNFIKTNISQLEKLPSYGSRVGEALKLAKEDMTGDTGSGRPAAKKLIVFVFDGSATDEKLMKEGIAWMNKDKVERFALSMADREPTTAQQTQLNELAGAGNKYIWVKPASKIEDEVQKLKKAQVNKCQRPSNDPPLPPPPASKCAKLDLIFALDMSASTDEEDWKNMTAVVEGIVNMVPDSIKSSTRIGLFVYASISKEVISLDDGKSTKDFMTHLHEASIEHVGRATFTSRMLSDVNSFGFAQTHGSRSDARKILVVVYDGQSKMKNVVKTNAEKLGKKGVVRISVAVPSSTTSVEFGYIAGDTGKAIYSVNAEKQFVPRTWESIGKDTSSAIKDLCA